tara:strand:- start:48 stop:845 length:798 start_codon:yes stop_codon:yes gene_type:complete
MAFKMKAGKEGPMKKNFPGVFKATTVKTSDDTKMSASKAGITVTGKGGKVSKYAPGDAGYNAAKQTYIDAGGESPMGMKSPKKLGSSTGMSGAQGRAKMKKPMAVDIDGNPVTEGGRRNYTPASVGTVLGGTPNQMKSPKKVAKKDPAMMMKKSAMTMKKSAMEMEKAAMKMMKKSPKKAKAKQFAGGITVYNDQGQIHAKYKPGDTGYNQAKMMLQNQNASPNNMKSPKKVVKTNTRKSAMKISQVTMNPTQAKKNASIRGKNR